MDREEFRRQGHRLVDWIAGYLEDPASHPVLSRVAPGDIRQALPSSPPREGEPFDAIMADFERVLVPGLTHWNHPGFMAYFGTTASAPAVLGEFLAAALNQQAMLWRTSPAATELEEVALGWLRDLIGLPRTFEGVIYDTASMSTLHGLAAAREALGLDVRGRGLPGRGDVPRIRIYASEQAHSSVDKAVITLGLGHESLRKIAVDAAFRMRVEDLDTAIREDRAAGWLPCAVVATVGTTSTTSVDPVARVADVCEREGLWLHVDGAYGGVLGMVPELAGALEGCDRADSMVVNPHKWLFVPMDLSAFFCRRMDVLRAAFSLVPEYLRTSEPDSVRNLMDTGVQLGRRFRALKLWMVLRTFGAEGLAARLREHVALGAWLAEQVDGDPDFERMAPTPFSVVCLRARPRGFVGSDEDLDRLNERLMEAVNADGRYFISHTRLHGRLALRVAIGNLHTAREHVEGLWVLLRALCGEMVARA